MMRWYGGEVTEDGTAMQYKQERRPHPEQKPSTLWCTTKRDLHRGRPTTDNILYLTTYWQRINNILKTYWQYTVCNTILTTYCLETIHVQSDNILFVTPYRQNNDDINSTFRKYSNFKNTAYLKWMYISHREFH